jgi:hypothetical protein
VHDGQLGAQEAHELHLALKARAFYDCVEYLLMERRDLPATLQCVPSKAIKSASSVNGAAKAAASPAFQA